MGEKNHALPLDAIFPGGLDEDKTPRKECCTPVNMHFVTLDSIFLIFLALQTPSCSVLFDNYSGRYHFYKRD